METQFLLASPPLGIAVLVIAEWLIRKRSAKGER